MIPYIDIPPIQLWGSVQLHPFGILVVTGCGVGFLLGRWHAGQVGLDQREFTRQVFWVLVSSFLLSRWVSSFLYPPGLSPNNLWMLFDVGASMSSYGGFVGGALGACIYGKVRRLPVRRYNDALALGLTAGWFFGRLGCTIVHDHPGIPSTFVLAVQFPDGARHDLGLYEWLVTIGLNVMVWSIRKKPLPPGALLGVVSLCYAPIRFLLDFLRIGEPTYAGLTLSQYASAGLFIIGAWLFVTARMRSATSPSSSIA